MTFAPPSPSQTVSPVASSGSHRRLHALGAVGLVHEACLYLRKPWVDCTRCRDACAIEALTLTATQVTLDAARCTGCGRCAVACPTAALAADGFVLLSPAPADAPSLTIACRSAHTRDPQALRVPCISGLHELSVLALLHALPTVRIELFDQGCGTCAATASGDSPAMRLAASLRERLGQCAQPADRVRMAARGPLPNGDAALRRTRAPAGRRVFLSGLARAAGGAAVHATAHARGRTAAAAVTRAPRAGEPIEWTGGHALRRLMLALAAQRGGKPRAATLARVTVSDHCRAHGTCARLCPTGALQALDGASTRQLLFDPWRCIDCGACARACPDQALRYEAPAERDFAPQAIVLSQVQVSACPQCGDTIPRADLADVCAACRRTAELARAGFALRPRHAGGDANSTGPP